MSSTHNPGYLSPPTTLSTKNLTYGVELEFVFAFHEDLIVFPNDAQYAIKKDLHYSTRQQSTFSRISSTFVPNRIYNSWGIQSSRSSSSAPNTTIYEPIQPWSTEPLEIVASILRQNIPTFAGFTRLKDLDVLDTLNITAKKALNWDNRNEWKITKDHSVCGVGSQNLNTWLPGKGIKADDWDSLGVELISPVMNSNAPGDQVRIGAIVDALTRDASQTGSFITNQCGLHVHVQGPTAAEFQAELNMSEDDAERHKARVWAYFALILLVYEEEIARLHPPCRRPGHANAEYAFQSNRLGFMKEHVVNVFPSRLGGADVRTSIRDCVGVDCSTAAISRKATIPQIRKGLNRYFDTDVVGLMNWPRTPRRGAIEKPGRNLGDKDRQVNMTYLMRPSPLPQTIEFGQAKGSLNSCDINHWADFCIGLVRLAYLYAADSQRFRVKNWRDVRLSDGSLQMNRIDVFDLMRDMELSAEAVTYWEGKVATYRAFTMGDEHDRLDDEVEPAGAGDEGDGDGSEGGKRPRDDDGDDDEEEKKKKFLKLEPRVQSLIESIVVPLFPPADSVVPVPQRHYPARRYDGLVDTNNYYCPDEILRYDGFTWMVPAFDPDSWMRMETNQGVTTSSGRIRNGVCACNALVQAMKAQYPASRFAQTEPRQLLPIMDRIFGGTAIDISGDQFVQVLREWTQGEFNLVCISPVDQHKTARRVGDYTLQELWGRNLYLRNRPQSGARRDHWESLRPATAVEREANGRKRTMGIPRGRDFL